MDQLNGARTASADLDHQRDQWRTTFATRRDFLGAQPSEPAVAALARFQAIGIRDVLELGSGQGRDTLVFARGGSHVTALDYAEDGLDQLTLAAAEAGLAGHLETVVADVRRPLPFPDARFDAVYAHLLFCMALTTSELERLSAEAHRVLRPGGLLVYTVRTTADAHFGAGVDHGDDMFEMGGFIVHFFDRALVDHLATGFEVLEVADYQEGRLPRRMFGVTLRTSGQSADPT